MYLIVMVDDGASWALHELGDGDIQACNDGIIDVFKLENGESISQLSPGGWVPIKVWGEKKCI